MSIWVRHTTSVLPQYTQTDTRMLLTNGRGVSNRLHSHSVADAPSFSSLPPFNHSLATELHSLCVRRNVKQAIFNHQFNCLSNGLLKYWLTRSLQTCAHWSRITGEKCWVQLKTQWGVAKHCSLAFYYAALIYFSTQVLSIKWKRVNSKLAIDGALESYCAHFNHSFTSAVAFSERSAAHTRYARHWMWIYFHLYHLQLQMLTVL